MRFVLALFLIGCGYCPYEADNYSNPTNYSIDPTLRTPNGIKVDSSNQIVDLNDIDRRTDEVEACLGKMFPDGVLPADIVSKSTCLYNHFDTHVHRDCLQVKIPPDWYKGCIDENWQYCSNVPGCGEEVFPCKVDPALCEAKGFTPTPECPCACRAMIQDNNTIVTAPNMHLYKSELIRLITSCNNIWTSQLDQCWSAN